jgi:hypothetical protein
MRWTRWTLQSSSLPGTWAFSPIICTRSGGPLYGLKGCDRVVLKELVPQQKSLFSMGLSLSTVSSTCLEHENTDLHDMGSKHNNGREHRADNAHLAIVFTS